VLIVPREFVERAERVVRHSGDPEKFDLLYRILVRLQEQPQLLPQTDDPDMRRFEMIEQPGNHPGGSSIPGQVEEAEGTASDMVGRAHPEVEPQHRKARTRNWPEPKVDQDETLDDAASIAELREAAKGCRRCPLWKPATQTVFGEGPENADVVFVGEQPGDQEDLAGRPFVGPAGAVFDAALEQAGIDRSTVYVTNAVKHFKFIQRGKRRIHNKPDAGEIAACRWWIDHERELIRPALTVALGATAGRSLFGKIVTIGKLRGEPQILPDGSECWITVHPSSILRAPDDEARREARKLFVRDLKRIKVRAEKLAA
ncbi:MAG: UdgX family uracil-DNA binding protein, partial [Sphingomicrobium sp.]